LCSQDLLAGFKGPASNGKAKGKKRRKEGEGSRAGKERQGREVMRGERSG